MSEMFPCEQRKNTREYRDNFEDIFGKKAVGVITEDKHGTKRKSGLRTDKR
jgi:F420-0:gamma-glutamyl ligase